jgi:hypothetical protein
MRRHPIRYRHNPPPLPFWGRRVMDEKIGVWTYENKRVMDEEGDLVDPEFGTYDVATGRGREDS